MADTDTKRCPFCGESILSVAIKCKHCSSMLAGDPEAGLVAVTPSVPCYFCKTPQREGAKVCHKCQGHIDPAVNRVLANPGDHRSAEVAAMSGADAESIARQKNAENLPKPFWSRWTVYPGLLLAAFGLVGVWAMWGSRLVSGWFTVACILGIAGMILFDPVWDAITIADGSNPYLQMMLKEKARLMGSSMTFETPCCRSSVNFEFFRDGTSAQCPSCKATLVRLGDRIYSAHR